MKKVKKAVVLVAGMGTRFLPITKSCPKEMLPIVDVPIIHYIVEEAVASGIEEILFVTSPYKKVIEDYFDNSYELEDRLKKDGKLEELKMVQDVSNMASIYYIRQGEPLGTAHAVSLAKGFVNDEPFALIYADNIIKSETPALLELIKVYEKYNCNVVGVDEVPKETINLYGIMDYYNADSLKIKEMVEKPKVGSVTSTSAALGRYILKPEVFDIIPEIKIKNGEYCLTEGMRILMNSQDFYSCRISGTWYDTGNQLGFLKANLAYAFDNEIYKKELLNFIKEIDK